MVPSQYAKRYKREILGLAKTLEIAYLITLGIRNIPSLAQVASLCSFCRASVINATIRLIFVLFRRILRQLPSQYYDSNDLKLYSSNLDR